MMTYRKAIIQTQTGEISIEEMSSEEAAVLDQMKKDQIALEKAKAAEEAARQSALEKLAALGLTEAEIQALAG